MGFHCPSCGREVYNRRRKNCEFCGSELPPSLRLSAAQLAYILNVKNVEARRHREFMERNSPLPDAGPDVGIIL
ncbi:MAG: hypothetical protein ACHRHE_14645 [Tepidisphaerales bacterium]